MRYLVSGGGTGGHVYPALAVARALRDARRDVELDYVGGVRGFERRLVAETRCAASCATTSSSSARCARPGLSHAHRPRPGAPRRVACRRPGGSSAGSRPAALFTTGGYLALPLVLAARARGIPTLVWEGNVQPGRATRAIGRFATRVAVSFPPTLDAFPGQRLRVRHADPLVRGHRPRGCSLARSASGPTIGCSSSSAGRRPWPA